MKQLKAKIDRDFKMNNPEVKELIAKNDSQEEQNNEVSIRLSTEKEKMDTLLQETVQLREEKKIALALVKKIRENREAQDLVLADLNAVIDGK